MLGFRCCIVGLYVLGAWYNILNRCDRDKKQVRPVISARSTSLYHSRRSASFSLSVFQSWREGRGTEHLRLSGAERYIDLRLSVLPSFSRGTKDGGRRSSYEVPSDCPLEGAHLSVTTRTIPSFSARGRVPGDWGRGTSPPIRRAAWYNLQGR
jgi:hypothetical protein